MKARSLLFVVLLVVVLVVAGCGGGGRHDRWSRAAKPVRIAVVMPSATTDMAFSQSMFSALKAVQAEMGGESSHGNQVLGEHVQGAGCRGRAA